MTESIVLHVGTHKTGSTSLQHFLHDHRDGLLAASGIAYPPGLVIPSSHAELPLVAIRPDLMWPARLRFPETRDPRWLAVAATRIRAHLDSAPHPVTVLSHEDLSYLRFDEEAATLRSALGARPVHVVVFLRDPAAFLFSYRAQLAATGFPPSDDPSSFAYAAPGSWLADFDALTDAYRRGFGADSVTVLDYDAALEVDGSAIPAFTDLLGIDRSSLPPLDRYFLNRAGEQLRPSDDLVAAIRRRLADQAGGGRP